MNTEAMNTHNSPKLMLANLVQLTPEVMQIEELAHAVPWSAQTFSLSFAPNYRVVGLYQLTNDGEHTNSRLIGFTVVHQVLDELTLMNIAVHPDFRGHGYGKMLLDDVISFASDNNGEQQWRIYLEVRESNAEAIGLYKAAGFSEAGRRNGYYPPKSASEARENAVIMVK
jgi:ribosomal-protein-alanine N-acetyltransferase